MEQRPLDKDIARYVRVVKMTLLRTSAGVETLASDELQTLDQMITSIVTTVLLYQAFEKLEITMIED